LLARRAQKARIRFAFSFGGVLLSDAHHARRSPFRIVAPRARHN
jgi:hypothetical protein